MRFIFIFIFFSSSIYCQECFLSIDKSQSSRFNEFISLENPSTEEIDETIKLADEYNDISLDTAFLLVEKSVEWTKKNNDKSQYCKALISLAHLKKMKGETDASLIILDEAKTLATKLDEPIIDAGINSLYGSIALNKGEFEKAINFFLNAAEGYELIGEKVSVAKKYSSISGVFFDTNQLEKCKEYNQKIIEIANELGSDDLLIDAGGLEGIRLMTKGIHYYLANQTDTANIESTMDTLQLYFKKSETKYDQTLVLARKTNNQWMVLTLLNNMVALANNMEKLERAEKFAFEAEKIAEELGSYELQIQSKTNLTSIYRRNGNYEKALKYGKEAVRKAKEHKLERKIVLANMRLFDLYVEMEMFKEALAVSEENRAYDLKLNDAQYTKSIAEIETKYQTARKEQQILKLETNNSKIKMQRNYLLGGGLFLSLLAFLGFRLKRLTKERNDKKAFSEALLNAQEDERKKIARDLHDGIGQSLLLIKKQMEKSSESTSKNQEMISETLEEVRLLSRDLHPFQLEKFGLTSTVENMIFKVRESTDLFITKEIGNIDNVLPQSSAIHVFRTIQEALSNVVKHADATAAKVVISETATEILITIKDNGKGFDPEFTLVKRKSIGLKTMQERISNIGGTFKIENGESRGTVVFIRIPKI